MKLIYCLACKDIVKLHMEHRTCLCGKSRGNYLKNAHTAEVEGPCINLGIHNISFLKALGEQADEQKKISFDAFVFPKNQESVHHKKND